METRKNPKKKIILRGRKLSDPGEMDRIKRQYAGIFPNSIPEVAAKLAKAKKKLINFSR